MKSFIWEINLQINHFELKISVGVIAFGFFFLSMQAFPPMSGMNAWKVSTLTGPTITTWSQECLGKPSLLNCLNHESLPNYLCRLYLAREIPIIFLSNRKEILIRLSCHYLFSSASSHSHVTEYRSQQISESQAKRCETLQQLELSVHVESSLFTVSRTDLEKMGGKTLTFKMKNLSYSMHDWSGQEVNWLSYISWNLSQLRLDFKRNE